LEQVRRGYQFVVVGYVVMPEHIHLLVSEPQEGTPSTVMQALKLGFARRVIAEARRLEMSTEATSRKTREVAHPRPRPPIPPVAAQHIWQKRFYDFNDRTQTHRETSLHASESRDARFGGVTGTLALEQFLLLLSQ